jgi:hypothetical protein
MRGGQLMLQVPYLPFWILMHTNFPLNGKNISYNVFIFAHQDDEAAIFWEIEKSIAEGILPIIFYLTSGTPDGATSSIRNLESLNVLAKFGIKPNQIFFLGSKFSIPDGLLIEHLKAAYDGVLEVINKLGLPRRLYFLAWEGGHQDHDAVHLIGVSIAKKINRVDCSYQFPLYSGKGLPNILFRLFSPLEENGKTLIKPIPLKRRIFYIKNIFCYPSQWKTWIGLLPFYIMHHLFGGGQVLQKVSEYRMGKKPHAGRMLYERRGGYNWQNFSQNIDVFFNECRADVRND